MVANLLAFLAPWAAKAHEEADANLQARARAEIVPRGVIPVTASRVEFRKKGRPHTVGAWEASVWGLTTRC